MRNKEKASMTAQELREAFLNYCASHPDYHCHPRTPIWCQCGYMQMYRRILMEQYNSVPSVSVEQPAADTGTKCGLVPPRLLDGSGVERDKEQDY